MRHIGESKEDIETWLKNIIVLFPKIKVIDSLVGQTRGICVQSVLAKWYCGCVTILLEMEIMNMEKRDKSWCRASILLASRKAEVRLRFPLPSDSWRRQQENGDLNLGSLLVPWT